MPKKILTVGIDLASEQVGSSQFSERTSLLDWDVVLFRPDIYEFRYKVDEGEYIGKPCLSDRYSSGLREACAHWRREISEAVKTGRTVVVFLPVPEEVYVATGSHEYSGTGRNRQAISHVELYSNYKSLPLDLKCAATKGSEMAVRPAYQSVLSSYWSRFGRLSAYNVVLEEVKENICITTKNGNRCVGVHLHNTTSNGHLLLLPEVDFENEDFYTDEKAYPSEAGFSTC